jgi:HD-like signal output (HDOD) protein
MLTRADAIAAGLAKVPHLAMLPDLALKVIRVADDPQSTASDMTAVITHSPALCARILRVVNSAFYGLPGQVSSIDRAIALMGLLSVKNVAIAASLNRAFEGRPLSATFGPKDLWLHSIGVAATARMVTVAMKSSLADEAFLAGLMHDIGVMVELQVDRAKLAGILKTLEDDDSADMLKAEEQSFSANHQDFGNGLTERWNLPASLTTSTGWHHRPFEVVGPIAS